MEVHRIGVISDTHGLLRPEVAEKLKGCEAILHGGDIVERTLLDRLWEIAPVYAVRGNVDTETWAKGLPKTLQVTLCGVTFFLIHNKKQLSADLQGVEVVVYGHSHKYEEKQRDGRLWLNPGSCGPRRFLQPVTMAVLEIGGDGAVWVEKCEFPKEPAVLGSAVGEERDRKTPGEKTPGIKVPENIREIIESAMGDVNRGKTVKEIAKKNVIDEALAEQICRLYLTHPGVDADGIMTKMGL